MNYLKNRLRITTNRRIVLPSICFLFILLVFSCKRNEEVSPDASLQLQFSEEQLFFDTVFTSQGSAWKFLWVYNRNSATLEFEEIGLAAGTSSSFDILINGQYRKSASNIRILAEDSMLLLIRANINPQNLNAPYLVRDSIVFKRAGIQQDVDLIAYGQDAVYLDNHTCACSETWYAGKPYVVMGMATVPASCTLTVKPGAQMFFHSDASLHVEGTLLSVGKPDSVILAHSNRLEDDQKRIPGSWRGIVFHETSSSNAIEWMEIAGAENTISIQADTDADTIPELTLRNAKLFNASQGLIDAGSADLYLYNVLLHTSVEPALKLTGGTVYMDHLTVANSSSLSRNAASVVASGTGKYRLRNSIVYGNQGQEISYGTSDFTASYCLIKGSGVAGTNLIFNQDPSFAASYNNNYNLNTGSPAINAGVSVSGQDRDLQNKLRDSNPDLGAYEK